MTRMVPRPLSFLKSTSSQASFLVLIFSKKVVFSLAKVGKVMMPFHIKTYISFMLNQEEYFSDCVRDDDPYGRRLAWC